MAAKNEFYFSMNRICIVLTCGLLLLTNLCNGQYEEKIIEMPKARNSIGLNLTPAAVVFMNGQNLTSRFSILYKRQTSINFRWRFTLNYETLENFEEEVADGRVVFFNDSLITYRLDNALHQAFDIRAGMEWFKPDRMFTMIYGVDVFAGIQVEEDGFDELSWDRNAFGFFPSAYLAPVNYTQEITYGYAGLDLSIGQQVHVKENLFVVIRWTPQIALHFPLSESYSDLELRNETPATTTQFRLRGLEVYANIRF